MGGVVVREGIWEDLYPMDIATAGSPMKAELGQKLVEALVARGAQTTMKFISPPSLAVFFAPLDAFSYQTAKILWTLLLFAAVVGFLWLFQNECEDFRLPGSLSKILVLLIGTGLSVCESVMMSNATPLVALASILALRGIRHSHVAITVFAFAAAGLLKGFSAAWIPALLVGGILVLFHLVRQPVGIVDNPQRISPLDFGTTYPYSINSSGR